MDCFGRTLIRRCASKGWIRYFFFALIGISSISFAQTVTTNAFDNAGNYSAGWTNGANGGTGFKPWVLSSGNGTSGYGGNFVGNPSAAGITGMSSSAFGQFANPSGSGAFANAEREFSNALAVGQTLSFQWAINFDSGNGAFASKGVVFSAGGNEIGNLNLQNAGSAAITIGGVDVGFGYGTNVMTWSFTRTGEKLFKVVANDRDGNGVYSNNITVSNGAMDKIKFYAYNMQAGDAAQPYFNDLTIITTDADSIAPVIALAQGVEQVAWVANGSAFSPSTSDVTASDNSGTVNVTFDPPTVNTAVDGVTKVAYTATDPSGNTATVVRVIAVGDASPGWRKLHSPKSATASAISSPKVYGRIYIDGATPGPGQAPNITAELGVNTVDSDPSGWTETGVWRAATYNPGFTGGDDEYESIINGAELTAGTYYYAYRFKIGTGAWQYAGINAAGTDGGPWNGTTSVSGVLTVLPVRNVSFAVNMNVQIAKGVFKANDGQGVELKGSFNNWGPGIAMSDSGQNGIYTLNLPIQGNSNSPVQYKFRITGGASDGTEWERVDIPRSTDAQTQSVNREFLLAVPGQEQVVSSVAAPSLFSFDDGVGPVITLSCDYLGGFTSKIQIEENSVFENPTVTSAVDVAEKNSDYQSALSKPSVDTVDPSIPGSYSLVYSVSDGNKNLSTRTVEVVVLPSRFTAWSQGQSTLATLNPEILAKYAIGGANTLTAQGEAPKVGTGFIVPNHYSYIEAIVRTDDSKLTIVGEASTDLDAGFASTGTWTTRGQADGVSQLDVPNGCERKRFIYWHGMVQERMFLRLRATLNP